MEALIADGRQSREYCCLRFSFCPRPPMGGARNTPSSKPPNQGNTEGRCLQLCHHIAGVPYARRSLQFQLHGSKRYSLHVGGIISLRVGTVCCYSGLRYMHAATKVTIEEPSFRYSCQTRFLIRADLKLLDTSLFHSK